MFHCLILIVLYYLSTLAFLLSISAFVLQVEQQLSAKNCSFKYIFNEIIFF